MKAACGPGNLGRASAAIYLDHNATAPLRPAAIEAMCRVLAATGNPSSIHGAGRAARREVEDARDAVAAAVALPAGGRITFTSGGTEANHLALLWAGSAVLGSAVEHDSIRVLVPAERRIAVDSEGVVDRERLEAMLSRLPRPAVVSIMVANNETGVLQPVAEIAAIAHRHGATLHCDAAQAVGRMPFDMAALGIDAVTLSAHKLGGPQGVGALVTAAGFEPEPLLRGGGQERGLRAGTENTPGIAGFGAAIAQAVAEAAIWESVERLRDRFEATLKRRLPEAYILGAGASRLPNTSCIALPGVPAVTQIMALDLAGIAVSAGSACSSGKVARSHVLDAMGIEPAVAESAIRISFGRDSGEAVVEPLLAALEAVARRAWRRVLLPV